MVLPRRTRPRHPDRTATNSNRKTSSPTYQVSQKAPSNFHQPAKRRGSDRGGRAEPTWYEIDGQCFFIVIGGGNLLQCKSASLTQRCRSKPSQGLNGHLGQYTGPQGGRKKKVRKKLMDESLTVGGAMSAAAPEGVYCCFFLGRQRKASAARACWAKGVVRTVRITVDSCCLGPTVIR